MKWNQTATLAAVLALSAWSAGAQQRTGLYTAKETSFDMFASYLKAERGVTHLFGTGIGHGSMGGGIGLNYFMTRNVGIGTDINIPNNGGTFVQEQSVNLTLRWPMGSSGAAPYVFGGGGRQYKPIDEWIGQVGVGLEYRSYHKLGIFADARYAWGDTHSSDSLLLRGGLRFVF